MSEEFEFIPPMKASLSSTEYLQQVNNDERWVAGEKFDGYREQLHFGSTRNEMFSSAGNSHIARCPQFQPVIPKLVGTILDGEGLGPTNMLEDNAACFKADPENAIAYQKTHGSARLVIFDVLKYQGEDCMHLPFEERVKILNDIFTVIRIWSWDRPEWKLLQQEKLVFLNKVDYWKLITARTQAEGHEGVILKNMYEPYLPASRGIAWLKVKREETLVCTITGFIPGTGQFANMVGSLMFTGETNGVKFTGYTSGMNFDERKDMTEHFDEKYSGRQCYVTCQEVTRLGSLRHPRFMGMVKEG